eukprot:359163-Chlamydomonas_euryale.AAC.3
MQHTKNACPQTRTCKCRTLNGRMHKLDTQTSTTEWQWRDGGQPTFLPIAGRAAVPHMHRRTLDAHAHAQTGHPNIHN